MVAPGNSPHWEPPPAEIACPCRGDRIDYIIGERMTEYPSIAMETLDTRRNEVPDLVAAQQDPARLPIGVVQREWDQTLARVREVCELEDSTTLVRTNQCAHLFIRKSGVLDIEAVERILFDNLLFSPWARIEHERSFIISGEWLWRWRRAAAWKADPVGHMIRLAPDAPQRMWTYHFNVIPAEV